MRESRLTLTTICLVIIAAAIVVRIYSFEVSTNFDADSISRSMIAAGWAEHPTFIWHPASRTSVWLPLPFYLDGGALLIWNNLLLAPRAVSFILALGALPLVFVAARRLFDRDRAYIATACLALFTLHIKHGNIASSESLFIFLLLLVMYFHGRLVERVRWSIIAGLSLAMTLMVMTRFEMWALPGFLIVMAIILRHPRGPQEKNRLIWSIIAASILPGLFIIAWMYGSYREFGDALYSINAASAEHAGLTQAAVNLDGKLRVIAYNIFFWPGILFLSLSPLILTAGIWGMILGLKRHVGREWIYLALFVLAVYLFQSTVTGELAPLARYAILPGTILCIFAGWGIYDVSVRFGVSGRVWVVTGVLLTAVITTIVLSFRFIDSSDSRLRKLASISPVSHYPGSITPIIEWLRTHIHPDDTVIFSTPGFESNAVVMYSELAPSQVVAVNETNAEAVRQKIVSRRPDYFILHVETPFQTGTGTMQLQDSLDIDGVLLQRDTTIGEFGIYSSRFR